MNMFRTLGYWSCTLAACCLAFSLTSCQKGKGGAAASADEQDEIYSLQTGNYFLPKGSMGGIVSFYFDDIEQFDLYLEVLEETDQWRARVTNGCLRTSPVGGMRLLDCHNLTGTVEHTITADSIIELDIKLQGDGKYLENDDSLDINIQIKINMLTDKYGAVCSGGLLGIEAKSQRSPAPTPLLEGHVTIK